MQPHKANPVASRFLLNIDQEDVGETLNHLSWVDIVPRRGGAMTALLVPILEQLSQDVRLYPIKHERGHSCLRPGGRIPGGRKLDLPCETRGFEAPHQPPGHVHFPPAQTLSGRTRESVMVVVPSFSVREQSNPPAICRPITGLIRPITPTVGRTIDEPGTVIDRYQAHEDTPHHERSAAGNRAHPASRS